MYKKIIKLGLITFLTSIMIIGLMGCNKSNLERNIERWLGIELPDNMEVLYNYEVRGFFQGGRPPQYTLFHLSETPMDLFSNNDFIRGIEPREIPAGGFGLHSYRHFVPDEFCPPWESGFYWMGGHPRFLIYFPNQHWLVFIVISN